MPGVNASYWLLTALSTELYLGMYSMMFIAALVLYFKTKKISPSYPYRRQMMLFLLCIFGLIGCSEFICWVYSPITFKMEASTLNIFISGLVIMITPCLLGYWYILIPLKHLWLLLMVARCDAMTSSAACQMLRVLRAAHND